MDKPDGVAACDWPGCEAAVAHDLRIEPGMTLTIDGREVTGPAFGFCETHAPRVAAVFLEALDRAERRHRARTHFAPGDAEWTDTFGPRD